MVVFWERGELLRAWGIKSNDEVFSFARIPDQMPVVRLRLPNGPRVRKSRRRRGRQDGATPVWHRAAPVLMRTAAEASTMLRRGHQRQQPATSQSAGGRAAPSDRMTTKLTMSVQTTRVEESPLRNPLPSECCAANRSHRCCG